MRQDKGRTSRLAIYLRIVVFFFVLSLVLGGLWDLASGSDTWQWPELLISSFGLAFEVILFGWPIVTIGGQLIYGDDPEYQQALRNGYRPFWDTLPWPLNPDSDLTRTTGLAEPDYEDFVPPPDWTFQCPNCGARVQQQLDVCWNCGYGSDGDSTAYYERWGAPPPDVPPHRVKGQR